MDHITNLQKQRSLSSIAGLWLAADRRRTINCGGAGDYAELYPSKRSSTLGRLLQLKKLWRKVMRKKRRVFDSSSPTAASKVSYDLETYAQNFDEGAAATEPENLSRSFSARFAAPPELLRRMGG
ncbi:uncharacterized protein LOC110026052 [Phalaenopsis equestris]|uniref:uncharacterized protein LOC110026052 n=1 Tax=Phalaenopsis equestris TaxID=78828 RepID=UPI0009E2537B|nr:uncharacterized protein LOC110026052 [Phalaenopsis equestris]